MSNEATEKKGGNRLLVIGAAVVLGLLAGGGAGAFFAGPLLANRAAPAEAAGAAEEEGAEGEEHAAPEEHAEEAGHGEAAEEGGHEEGGAAAPMYVMNNLVLNPARSNGTRFLMTTVAFGMKSEAGVAEMEGRDLEVRDRVLRVLGAKTVMELADVAKRDSLKVELKDSVGVLFGEGAVRDVYFPQFVIQ